ncbi:hypothetical protein GALL_509280 [mine drainage metagenome]|uniref:Uncharacterized protein n=1 Tax=mine drainage metagenome TaxID=410659 RepID=A0A1J5PV86_9ZZZZ
MKRAVEGDIHDLAPFGEAHVSERLFPAQRRVVDEDIDPAEMPDRRLRHRLHLSRVGDVADMHERLPARGFDLACDGISLGAIAARIDHDGRATVRQSQRNRAADIAASARDNGDLAVEFSVSHHPSLST